MVKEFKQAWSKLSDKQKSQYQKLAIILGAISVLIFIFSFKDNSTSSQQDTQEELISVKPINHFDADSFRQDLQYKQQQLIDKQSTVQTTQAAQIEKLTKQIAALQQHIETGNKEGTKRDQTENKEGTNREQKGNKQGTSDAHLEHTKSPSSSLPFSYPPSSIATGKEELSISAQPRLIGAITKAVFNEEEHTQVDKRNNKVFILPPGFFSARTMEGIEVGSGFNAQSNFAKNIVWFSIGNIYFLLV